MKFLVNTEAQFSFLKKYGVNNLGEIMWVQRANGTEIYEWTTHQILDLATGQVIQQFIKFLTSPYNLLGIHILHKLWTRTQFPESDVKVIFGEMPMAKLLWSVADEHLMFDQFSQGDQSPLHVIL